MKIQNLFLMVATTGFCCSCGTEKAGEDGVAHYTSADRDETVSLTEDFYQHTNGGWIKAHPMPSDRSRYGAFDMLQEQSIERLRELVEEAQKSNAAKGTPAQKIGDLYALSMDTARRNAEGLKAIESYIEMSKAVDPANKKEFAKTVAKFQKVVFNPFFNYGKTPDFDDSSVNIADVWQAGIGLPDREYYFKDGEKDKEIIAGYKQMISKFLAYAGAEDTENKAEAVFEFEKKMAGQMNKREENRNPLNITNKVPDVAALAKMSQGFDWEAFLEEMGGKRVVINVGQPKYMGAIWGIVNSTPKEVVQDYFLFHTMSSFATDLTSDLYAISFDFYSKQLSGVDEMKPMWKRSLGAVESCLGEELGKLFVAKYFPESSKKRMTELIEQLRVAFGERIDNLTWMGDSTKAAAKAKLAAIKLKIGYPDKWKDYSSINIDTTLTYAENLINVALYESNKDISEIGEPVDKEEWHMTPQTINAYYSPLNNEIVFPAGILQPPFFYANGDDAVNYGAIGVVIGHEMTHGFDDQGSHFDAKGNMVEWWTAEDREQFTKITDRLVDHFSSLTVIDDIKSNGRLTLGENIADLGGLNIAHQAFRNTLKGKAEPALIDGQTAEQRFFYAYSRVWAGCIKDEAARQQVMTDPHSTGKLRVNGQLPLLDFFYDAFDVKEGSAMYMPKEERIVIW